MVRRRRLHEGATVEHEVVVASRPHADDVSIEREVERRRDVLRDRELDELLHEPSVDRRPDQAEPRAQLRRLPEVPDLGDHVRLVHDDEPLSRNLCAHSGDISVRSDDVAGAEWLEETGQRPEQDLRSRRVACCEGKDGVDVSGARHEPNLHNAHRR